MSQRIASASKKSESSPAKALATSQRIWEVDSWRGVAIVMMVIFHLMWDLVIFGVVNVPLGRGFWFYFQRFTATSFILLVGISLVISYNRARQRPNGTAGLYQKFLVRGLKILAIALVISLVVRLQGQGRIDFGVLHFIGTAIIIAYPFLRFRRLNLLFAALLFAASYVIRDIQVESYLLVWLGFEPPNYFYLDYFPLVHWFAVVLIGIFIGNTLYADGKRQFLLPDFSIFFPLNLLQFLGRHSLLIYVVHQPLLYAILYALSVGNAGI